MHIHMQHFVMCLLLHTTLYCVNGVTGGGGGGHVSECACMARLIICSLSLLFPIYLYNYSLVDGCCVPQMAAQAGAVYSCMLEARRNRHCPVICICRARVDTLL